jgi:RNA polymerase sigma-70 factor (ECF subfamily)
MAEITEKTDFDSILLSTQTRIRAYIAGMGIAPHEVDDVAQDVYLEYYKNFEKQPKGVAPERWLKGIAKNLCLNHIRRCARRGRLHHQALAEILAKTQSQLEHSLEHGSMADALDSCVRKLPPKSRKILKLRYEDDLSSQAIADSLESTSEAIRVALFRIRAGLKECIANCLAHESS